MMMMREAVNWKGGRGGWILIWWGLVIWIFNFTETLREREREREREGRWGFGFSEFWLERGKVGAFRKDATCWFWKHNEHSLSLCLSRFRAPSLFFLPFSSLSLPFFSLNPISHPYLISIITHLLLNHANATLPFTLSNLILLLFSSYNSSNLSLHILSFSAS